MCGIASILDIDGSSNKSINSMIDSINHRGPDHKETYLFDGVALASCRLSIFDLSEKGNMPMHDLSKRYVIIFNGEIYNFKDLKKQYNIQTKSSSDTEVLIELFSKIGVKSFNLINGIYSFIILDKLEKKLFCVRDRMGVKPLYFSKEDNRYYFCSEIKGIKKVLKKIEINEELVKYYLSTSYYDFSKETFYKNIFQVKQGTYLEFNLNKNTFHEKKYWDLTISENKSSSLDLHKLFKNSFNLQQQTDTKIGINVSSGIDSNLMISYLNQINGGQKEIKANSLFYSDPGFDHRDDLSEMSKYYKWKIDLFEMKSQDVIDTFDKVSFFQDEPFPGVATIGKHLLIQNNYSSDCKVILEGQGGDDFAGGYKYIFPLFLLDLLKNLNLNQFFKEIKSFKEIEKMNNINFLMFFYYSTIGFFKGGVSADGTSTSLSKLLNLNIPEVIKKYNNVTFKYPRKTNFLKKIIYRDIFYSKLPRILRSHDRLSMAHSKELRVPMLDHNIVEYFFSLQNKDIVQNGILRKKYRDLCKEQFKNNKFLHFKKRYTPSPQTKWLRTSLFEWMYYRLTALSFDLNGIIDKKKLPKFLEDFKKNDKANNSNFIWMLLNLEYLFRNIK